MADIDDPTGKIEEHYFPNEDWERQLADEITDKALLPLIPQVGWLVVLIRNFLKGRAARGELLSLCHQISDLCKAQGVDLDQLKERIPTDERMLQLGSIATERTLWGANEKKRDRFAAVVAGTYAKATSDQQYEDAAYFIRALDELSEDDIKVLKHLYNHQKHLVIENHAMPYSSFFPQMLEMLRGALELGMQIDDVFARMSRLTGYGLALELNTKHGSMGNPDDFAFRLTLLGKRLIEMLIAAGEDLVVTHRR
jgi:hypothetical protein